MKTLVIIAVIALTGCAAPPPYRSTSLSVDQQPLHLALSECRYEVAKATVAIRNPFDKAFETNTLGAQCMSIKGYVR